MKYLRSDGIRLFKDAGGSTSQFQWKRRHNIVQDGKTVLNMQ
jgi:hypothetical protein